MTPYRGDRPKPDDEEPEYKVPKPWPAWALRAIGAGMMLPFVAVLFSGYAGRYPVLFIGTCIIAMAGMTLVRGRIPWVGGG
jgi:hypothetical protein